MDRKELLLQGISKDGTVIEIGPSYNPLMPKSEGWNSFTVDHATREDLVQKYKADPTVDVSRIEDVDAVWTGGLLADIVPSERHGTFDVFIASHVIEHTTDVVSFLKSAEVLIKPDGVILLAVPDKRKCFDYYRHPSTLADAMVAFSERRTLHDARTHLDYAMRMANKGGAAGWSMDDVRQPVLAVSIEHAPGFFNRGKSSEYIDAHNWVFVPASFELLVLELSALAMLNLRVDKLQEMPATEFLAWLRKAPDIYSPEEIQVKRIDLMDRIIIELAEQSRQIPYSPLALASRARQDRGPASTILPR